MKNDNFFLFKKISSALCVLFTNRFENPNKNETLKGNYISWQYKYSGMNKVSQTFSLGRALLKTVNLWPLSGSQTVFIQNQISFFYFRS